VHKVANVLNALPKSAQPAARKALAEIRDAEDKDHATRAINAFSEAFAVKYPRWWPGSSTRPKSCSRSSTSSTP
jgi:transposase-like protein